MSNFYTEIYINAPTDKVWEAFTGQGQFFMAFYHADIRSTFQVGDRMEYAGMYDGKDTVHIYGKILAYEAGKLLAYTDHPGPDFNENHAETHSRVQVTFDAIGPSTRLTLTNDRFSPGNPMEAEASQWWLILSNLKTWVETGKLMPLETE